MHYPPDSKALGLISWNKEIPKITALGVGECKNDWSVLEPWCDLEPGLKLTLEFNEYYLPLTGRVA